MAVGDLNVVGAEATAERIAEGGGNAVRVASDLADEDSVHALIERAVSELGGLDGLFNVGANVPDAVPDRDTDLLGMAPEIWRRTFEVNLLGYTLACRATIPHLLAAGGGAIVNCSSGGAWAGLPVLPAYSTSKAGVNALTRHIASRWGQEGSRCNAVAPGRVVTEPLQRDGAPEPQPGREIRSTRVGRPADIAATVALLLSDDGEWVNGQTWSVCGGASLRE
ncbi:SDR family oxidoreductase [Streptomyces sp. KM273126]|uniref:SDR family NAD(P)-dependent oxidoreductase n=1 Tax=Streptomyces sp. KM273126 TaxID=2545247 RepID=UPI00267DEE36|nr:SDR family oxidoreductase [Streptomyces sp. KM273126]